MIDYYCDLIESFFSNKQFFLQELEKSEDLLGQKFNRLIAPALFSGDTRSAKYLFLTMNPVESDHGFEQTELLSEMKRNEIEMYFTRWFEFNEHHSANRKTKTFPYLNLLVDSLENTNHGGYFKALDKSSVVVDLIPFYSKTSSFNKFDISTGYGKEIWDRIRPLMKSVEKVFMVGSTYSKIFNQISGHSTTIFSHELNIKSRSGSPHIVSLYNKDNIYYLDKAVTARGMSKSIFTQLIPEHI